MSASSARRLGVVPERPRIVSPYVRVSAVMGREDARFHSPEMQLEEDKRLILSMGAIVGPVLQDIDESGRSFDRAGIQRGLKLIESGEIDGIASVRSNRFGRNLAESARVLKLIRKRGGVFWSVMEPFFNTDNPTPVELMMQNFVMSLDEMESNQKKDGWRGVIRFRFEHGLTHGQLALGYVRQHEARNEAGELLRTKHGRQRMTGDPVLGPLADTIRELFERYDAGDTKTSLSRSMRARGVFTGPSTITRLLSNPFYVGKVRLWAYVGEDDERHRVDPPMVLDGHHPPLVDAALFARVQQRLAAEAQKPRRRGPHALVGLARCAHCRRAVIHFGKDKRGYGPYYLDRNGVTIDKCIGIGSPIVQLVEDAVRDDVRVVAQRLRAGDPEYLNRQSRRARAIAQVERLAREIEKVQHAIGKLNASMRMADVDARALREAEWERDAYREKLAALEEQRDSIVIETDVIEAEEVVTAAQRLDELWNDASPELRNELLRRCKVREVLIRHADYPKEPVADRVQTIFAVPL